MDKKYKKKIIINVIVIILVLIGAFFYLFKTDAVTIDSIKQVKFHQVLLVFLFFFAAYSFFSVIEKQIYKTFTDKMGAFGNFFNIHFGVLGSSITPFRSGHFPMMIYYQQTRGLKIDESLTGFAKTQMIYSFTSIVTYSMIFIFLLFNKYSIIFQETTVYLWQVMLVGLLFHFVVFGGVLLITFNKRFQRWLFKLIAKLIGKIKKSFDQEKFLKAQEEKFDRYQVAIIDFFKHFVHYIPIILMYTVHKVFIGLFQYASYIVFTGNPIDIVELSKFFVLNFATTYIANIIPLPGGVGTSEVLFSLVYVSVIDKTILGSVLILWRVSTYYLPLILEAIMFITVSIIRNRRLYIEGKEEEKKEELKEAEVTE